ncbi:MAG: tetratricopeptide repeat protein [bacterium]
MLKKLKIEFSLLDLLIASILFVATIHCGSQATSPVLRSAEELTEEGWQAFESGDFALAVTKFDSAVISDSNFVDAFNGAGWSYAQLGEFSTAIEKFETAIALDSNLIEVHAGASLVYHALNQFIESINEANITLETEPEFVFSHDPSINALDIRITLALSYFSIADFINAAIQMDIIDPVNSPHSTDPDELIREIMRFFGQIR